MSAIRERGFGIRDSPVRSSARRRARTARVGRITRSLDCRLLSWSQMAWELANWRTGHSLAAIRIAAALGELRGIKVNEPDGMIWTSALFCGSRFARLRRLQLARLFARPVEGFANRVARVRASQRRPEMRRGAEVQRDAERCREMRRDADMCRDVQADAD